ncbi:retrovirus-related pol polyprotein from transposon TNT 1-94 [Tanacetum coccineum]|uniref:Retrovirus-related pol polyprotein from transposon TNT 1-94 n=1 Tax=Tanacetum coccineum TaxID=301880 RepID=A0ABQ5FL37_9ASTR
MNGDALRKCVLEGPYTPSTVIIPAIPATDDSPEVPERTAVETILNMSPENKAHYELEKEAIQLLLTGIGDEIYLTFLQQLQPEWSIFVTIVKQNHDLDTVSYHKLFNVLKQYQKEVNEIRAERIAKNAKTLALIYKPTNNNLETSSNSRNKNVDTSPRYKNDNQTGQFRNQRTVTIVGARETVGSQVVQQIGIQCFNCKEFGHFAKECRKPKRVKDYMYHKEKMLLCKQAEKGVPLQAEQADWLADMDEEIDEQELEAHYSYMANIQEIQTQLKKANTSLAHELKECRSILTDTSRTLRESNSIRDSCLIALQNKYTELETYKTLNDYTVDYDKLEQLVDQAWEKHYHDHFRAPTAHDMEILIKTCLMPLALKTQNDSFKFVHKLKQEMHADLKYVESLEKEIDKLESDKAEFSNIYDILLQECVSNDVMCSYLHSLSDFDAHTELQCLYLHKVKECECLVQNLSKQTKTVSKEVYNELSRSFDKLEKLDVRLSFHHHKTQK